MLNVVPSREPKRNQSVVVGGAAVGGNEIPAVQYVSVCDPAVIPDDEPVKTVPFFTTLVVDQ